MSWAKTSEEKKAQIKHSIGETRRKRKTQFCQVFELKIDESRLNKVEKETLKMFFIEAKWLYNYILSQENVFEFDSKQKEIEIMNKDGNFEHKTLRFLPAKNRQDVRNGLYNSIKGLAALKRKGKKVGKLKHKKQYRSLWFSQYGVTHYIKDRNHIKIAGVKRPLLVRGLKQITKKHEVTDMKLLQKADGYYIKLTTYIFPEGGVQDEDKTDVGIDYGIKTSITTSDGNKFNVSIEEPDRLKRLQRRASKQVKGSNNRHKTNKLIAIEYQKLDNKKKEAANKILHHLRSNYSRIFMQDENLKGWHHGLFGKQVQHSILGLIKAKLLGCKQTIVIDRWVPTTKACYICGVMNELDLNERIYRCECGLVEDRDIKAAKTCLKFGQMNIGIIKKSYRQQSKMVPMECREPAIVANDGKKPVEMKTSTLSLDKRKPLPMKQEARDFNHG